MEERMHVNRLAQHMGAVQPSNTEVVTGSLERTAAALIAAKFGRPAARRAGASAPVVAQPPRPGFFQRADGAPDWLKIGGALAIVGFVAWKLLKKGR